MGNEFSTPSNLKFIIIHGKSDAQALLDKAEREDMYLEECHDDRANSIARRTLTYAPNQMALRDMTYANSYIESTMGSIPVRLLTELREVNIIQLMPTADGGMPHTRPGGIICYPNISQLFSTSTLIHELWHVHQRIYQEQWLVVFKRLGWSLWQGELPEKLEKNRRYNPDTIDCPLWIYDGTWVPIPIFKDITHPTVNNVEVWFYNPNKRYHTRQVPEELSSYYSNLNNIAFEHPREITAYMLSEPDKFKSSTAYKHLIEAIGHTAVYKTA
jgi:hypothetical protein